MIRAEAYLVWNAAMCLCALPLGGKLAGLPLPRKEPLFCSAGAGAVLALAAAYQPVFSVAALLGLPLSVAACFHAHGAQACMRCAITTLAATLLLGGAASALTVHGMPAQPAALVSLMLGALCYLLVTLLPNAVCEVRQVELKVDGHAVLLPAMLDSGNLLRDPVTGLPVLVVPCKAARLLFPDIADPCDLYSLPLGFRLLNVRTAAGSSLLPLFRPDECRLYLNGRACQAQLLVAVAGREYGGVQALVPMAALPHGELSL